MKIWMKKLLVLAVGAVLLLTGCSGPSSGPSKPEQNLVGEKLTEEGVVTTEWGQSEYSYHVPEILGDTLGAKEINDQIELDFLSDVDCSLQDIEEGMEPYVNKVSWKSYQNGDILSLLVEVQTVMVNTTYYSYNYDCKAGEYLPYFDLLQRVGLEYEEYAQAFIKPVAAESDRMMEEFDPEYWTALAVMRAQSINFNNLIDSQVFLGENGSLQAVVAIDIPAGGGIYQTIVPVRMDDASGADQTVSCGFVQAELKNGKVTLTFHEKEHSELYLWDRVEYEKPYPVEGLYGTYTDLFVGVLGQDFFPYLFLADDQGHVTCCDVMLGVATGGRFFGTGPLPGIRDVVSFQQSTLDGEAQTVLAHTRSGEDVDLSEAVWQAQNIFPDWPEDCSWGTWDMRYTVSFLRDEGTVRAIVYEQKPDQELLDVAYTAQRVNYLGMDDVGMYFSMVLHETNPTYETEEEYREKGTVPLLVTVPGARFDLGVYENDVLWLEEPRGNGFWDYAPGELVELYQSFG